MRKLYPLIFSNGWWYRVTRHTLFWLIWISFYAFIQTYRLHEYRQISILSYYPVSWGEMLIQIPIDISFCYLVIYFVLPRFFTKGDYLSFIIGYVFLMVVCSALQNLYYSGAVTWYRSLIGLQPPARSTSFTLGTLMIIGSLNTEGAFAIAIKLGKMFIIKQQQAELLFQEKEQMYKTASIYESNEWHSTFLTSLLSKLYAGSPLYKTPITENVDSINSLVVYSGYRNIQGMLPLQKELDALQEYIKLQNSTYCPVIDTKFVVEGDPSQKHLAYYLLIPLAEYCFNSLPASGKANRFVHTLVRVETNTLFVRITSSKSSDTSTLMNDHNVNLQNVEKRLKLIYPGNFQFRKIIEPEKLTIYLQLALNKKVAI